MAYELYQSRHKGYEIDNLLDDVVDLNADVAALKTEYDANKVKMSDGTILPMHLVNTYATKTDLNAKADSTQVAADIATATTDMATNTSVASAIATATADMATNTSVASDIATATTDMATNASVAAAIAAAAYTLPEATTSTLGGVKPDGTTITVDADGTIHGASDIDSLGDIGDVSIPNPQNNQVLTYDATASKWMAKYGGGGGSTSYVYICDVELTETIDGATTITLSNLAQSNDRSAVPTASDIYAGVTMVYDEKGTVGIVTSISGSTITIKTMDNNHHTIVNSAGSTMVERGLLKFGADMVTSDDTTNEQTVVTPHELTSAEIAEIMTELPTNPVSTYVPSCGYTPVGTIISVMGNYAPRHYLACDGAAYPIAEYPVLAKYFKEQFGSEYYFGGDGTSTFAVPDLRGEFLRGTGTNVHTNQGNGGAVGAHQDATEYAVMGSSYEGGKDYLSMPHAQDIGAWAGYTNADKTRGSGTNGYIPMTGSNTNARIVYASPRPTNTSVLYCIAVQDIYIDAKCNYSTDEQVVGTWINGKPLYQKTLTGTTPSASGDVATGLTNIENIFIVSGYIPDNINNGYTVSYGYFGSENDYLFVDLRQDASSLYFSLRNSRFQNRPFCITVQYTKTTD